MENNMLLLDKVKYLLQTAAQKTYSEEDFKKIIALSSEDSNDYVLKRVMGYSVSDYALASLKWIGSNDALDKFKELYDELSNERRKRVDDLVAQNYHFEYIN